MSPLSALLLKPIACNLTLLRLHNNFQPTPSNTLQLHTGLASGRVCGIYTGVQIVIMGIFYCR